MSPCRRNRESMRRALSMSVMCDREQPRSRLADV
jgi:hypothetical protein